MLDFASVYGSDKKGENQDFLSILEEGQCTFFAVCDGKGNDGFAKLVAQTMMEDFRAQSTIGTDTLPSFMDRAQQVLTQFQEKEALIGGCCAAVMITNGDLAVWANIGDARIYHLKDRWLYEITPDHSEAYSRYEAGQIRYPRIRTDRLRYRLYRMMGMGQEYAPKYAKPVVVRKNDCFLLCTDGFWAGLHERQIERTARRAKNAQDWMDRMMKLRARNKKNGRYRHNVDDYSAVCIQI